MSKRLNPAQRAELAAKRLEEAKAKAEQTQREAQAWEAQQLARSLKGASALDTKRKILLGAAVLAQIKSGGLTPAQVGGWLSQLTLRADEARALSDLLPAQGAAPSPAPAPAPAAAAPVAAAAPAPGVQIRPLSAAMLQR